jgi:hypothetical protein
MAYTIAQQMQEIIGALKPAAQAHGGDAFVCSDLVHLWKQLFDKSNSEKVLLMYNGEQIRGEFGIAACLGRVDRQFIVVVSRGRGLTVERGTPLIDQNQNADPMFTVVEGYRDIIRGLVTDPIWTEYPVDYIGIIPFPTGNPGLVVDAYQIQFSIGSQLQLIQGQPGALANE